jgi:hypothetical protein
MARDYSALFTEMCEYCLFFDHVPWFCLKFYFLFCFVSAMFLLDMVDITFSLVFQYLFYGS